MAGFINKTAEFSLALVLLLLPAAALAATDNTSDQDSKNEREAKSYLPPWMQQEAGEVKGGSEAAKSSAVPDGPELLDDAEAKKKATQRIKPRPRSDISFFERLFGR